TIRPEGKLTEKQHNHEGLPRRLKKQASTHTASRRQQHQGSRAASRPLRLPAGVRLLSPIRFTAKTVVVIISPGTAAPHQLPWIKLICAEANMPPQLGIPGPSPSPR